MGKRPKLELIEKEMERGEDFELTENQYYTKTGAHIPLNKSYTQRKSAVAKRAEIYGYSIEMIPAKLIFKKNK